MAVKDTLNKIVERHPDVIGAMVMHKGSVQHNLDAPYDIVAVDAILETFGEMFEQTSMLEDEGFEFGEMIMDLANHSLIVRAIDDGLLGVLAPSLQRGQLVKLHVGLGLFGKAIEKAIAEEFAADAPPPVYEEPQARFVSRPLSQPVTYDDPHQRLPSRPMSQPVSHEDPLVDESSLSHGFGRRRGGFRGTKEMIANRLDRAPEATSEPQPKEESVPDDGIPRHPDGTPKKMRKYRGQIFWE